MRKQYLILFAYFSIAPNSKAYLTIAVRRPFRTRWKVLPKNAEFFFEDDFCDRNNQTIRQHQKGNDGDLRSSLNEQRTSNVDRRSFLSTPALWGACSSFRFGEGQYLGFLPLAAANVEANIDCPRLSSTILRSMVYEKVLGAGSYKTVYLVSSTLHEHVPVQEDERETTASTRTLRFALAVERLRNKRDVRNAFRGVRIPEAIRKDLADEDKELFESILDWWIQPSNLPDFSEGEFLFPGLKDARNHELDLDKAIGRSRSEPGKNFAGSRWMLSFKPVYETDLKRFIRNRPILIPVGSALDQSLHRKQVDRGLYEEEWNESVLLTFILETLHAGKLMHHSGFVHRDIKPKNIMVMHSQEDSRKSRQRPVIIDYGFAESGSPTALSKKESKRDICVVRPGQLKGEVEYVLAEDLENYRGCQRGDVYAMGKTLYEFVFASPELLAQQENDGNGISVHEAESYNNKFRKLVFEDSSAADKSRFLISPEAASCLMFIIRGMCGDGTPEQDMMTFVEAEEILSKFILSASASS